MHRIIFEPTQIKCFITCGPVRDLILNSRDFLLHSNVGLRVCTYRDLGFFIYLFNSVGTISKRTPAADHQPPMIQVHLAPFILFYPTVQENIYIQPPIHLAMHWMPCRDIFYVILSKAQPTCFNINHALPRCRGALQSRSETADGCEHSAGYEYTLSWARADYILHLKHKSNM